MEKLEIGFSKQGYIVNFGLSLNTVDKIKALYPKVNPILQIAVGYNNVENTLEPYREPITKYVLPLLTGLDENQLKEFKEITILNRPTNHEYLKIVSSQKKEQKTLELATV